MRPALALGKTSAFNTNIPLCVRATSLPIQLSTNNLRKAAEDDPRVWVPATQLGNSETAQGS